MKNSVYYSFTDLIADVDYLKGVIDESKYMPDVVVGLARGGLIPAVMLSHKLGLPMCSVKWSTRDHIGTQPLEKLKQYRDILIVDDICDSGKTLTSLVDNLRHFAPITKVKTCTLHYNTSQSFKVDYFVNTIDRTKDDRWIIYQWEIT
jgi:hypothetical protein